MVGLCITSKPWRNGPATNEVVAAAAVATPYTLPSGAIGTFHSKWTAALASKTVSVTIDKNYSHVYKCDFNVPATITDAERRIITCFITHDLIYRCKELMHKSKNMAKLNVYSLATMLQTNLKLDSSLVVALISVFALTSIEAAPRLRCDGKSIIEAAKWKSFEYYDAFETMHKKKANIPLARKALEREICDPSSDDVQTQKEVLTTLKKLSARTGQKRPISEIPRGPVAWSVYDCGSVMVPTILPGGCMFAVLGAGATAGGASSQDEFDCDSDDGSAASACLVDVNVGAIVLGGHIKRVHAEFCYQPNNPPTPSCGVAAFLV